MSEEYGPDFITVIDDDGNEIELEFVDMLEYNGSTYMAFFPTVAEGDDEDSEEFGLIILESVEENGETYLNTIDNDDVMDAVYDEFMKHLMEDEDEDE